VALTLVAPSVSQPAIRDSLARWWWRATAAATALPPSYDEHQRSAAQVAAATRRFPGASGGRASSR